MHIRVAQILGWSLLIGTGISSASAIPAPGPSQSLPGHTLPEAVTTGAKQIPFSTPTLSLAIRLRSRNNAALTEYLEQLYSPGSPHFHKYLTPEEYITRFGATREEVNQVSTYFRNLGCNAPTAPGNPLQLDVQCPRAAIEKALRIKIMLWDTPSHEVIQTIDADPTVPSDLPIEAIIGLTSQPRHSKLIRVNPALLPLTGSGPNGGLSPSDIKTAYNLNSTAENGSGQTLGLFELDGYLASDIAAYRGTFGISPAPALQNVLVDGFNGSAGSGAIEVVADIEMMMAIAPGATRILVYEGPNTDAGVIDTYQKIANDNLAKQISTSWGISEDQNSNAVIQAESQIFKQLAAQGQTIYAASGDSGAFDNGKTLSVDDPASQPYMSGVGGTTLRTNANHTYASETTWFAGASGSGGGISAVWSIPSYQVGVVSAASQGSNNLRNVPDVAMNADPATGYAVYVSGSWTVVGGTSLGAPIWAAFTALVNQRRTANGLAALGFANPAIYPVAVSADYPRDFHDIADGSKNGFYPAVTRYDLATGWGSLIGADLQADLASATVPSPGPSPSPSPSPPAPPPSGCAPSQRPMTQGESAGAALSTGLPFVAGYLARRRRRKD